MAFDHLLSLTENGSATFSSSSDPSVDFFFHIVPDTPPDKISSLLSLAWIHHPLTALKLVFHLRAVRGTGKSDREAFYVCASWIHRHHPLTLLANLRFIPKFGYFKDLLEIVRREVDGPEETVKRLEESRRHKSKVKAAKSGSRNRHPKGVESYWKRKGAAARKAKLDGTLQDREARVAAALDRDKDAKEKAALLRRKKRKDLAARLGDTLSQDARFEALQDAVADLFAKQLEADKQALDGKKFDAISLCAKWCPSPRRSYDLRTGLYHAIASKIVPKEGVYADLSEEAYRVAIEDKLRKEYLVPLRKILEIPETYMSANEWHVLPYRRVPSVAMTRYAELFVKHDKDRYEKFLMEVAEGKFKVAAGALLPHEIANVAVTKNGSMVGVLAESQWKRMVSDLKEAGSKLSSSMAVCDVSGSMIGTPMEVCIALGLLVAELSDEPWKNHVCTFSSEPQIHEIVGDTLAQRYTFTQHMDWGFNTDFQKVFRKILHLAQLSQLPADQMMKRLFVFSDMEFDQASANPWETDYVMIRKMFEEAGYGEPPQIVFWNLRDSSSTPVLSNQNGVALVSGFSKNLLKIFLDDEPLQVPETEDAQLDTKQQSINPRESMLKALSEEIYEELVVVD